MHQVLGLGLEGVPWLWPWMLGVTLYLTQAASDKNSLLHWCLLAVAICTGTW